MAPEEYYQNHISTYTRQLKHIQKRRNLITTGKLFTFALAVFQIYWLISTNGLFFLYPALTVMLFILLTIRDNRIVKQLQFTEELIRIHREELDYLAGQLSGFPTGATYLFSAHPYAGDLDLFGEDSLFQHLNRTVTSGGSDLLAHWLLTLSKDPSTIRQRQQAMNELSEHPGWCQQFRAQGRLRSIREVNHSALQQWQKEPVFFPYRTRTRIALYTLNGVTLFSWILAISGISPWSLALIFSFGQLLILTLYLKKINLYHRKLDLFISSISNYLPLVRLFHQQTFTSVYLQEIQSLLSGHAEQALRRLTKIRERLDQRANILAAFLLNGIYLRDIHTLLSLDRWKQESSHQIDKWSEAISTTDVLISMAIFRFNHPTYTIPQFSTTSLLVVREAGHPLLKKHNKVTNNFRIDNLHQLYIVTGANMAGKSTFLRTVGINLVLAQSGNVVDCTSFSFQPMALFTSMRTTDNLARDTSYFHAELLRLKQLVTTAGKEERLFIILDEMLKGTNSVDKLNGSLAFLRKLLSYPVSGLIATHDLALGELARDFPGNFFNVCFEITHTEDNIHYDYKLHPGISNTMNASILLKQMGLI